MLGPSKFPSIHSYCIIQNIEIRKLPWMFGVFLLQSFKKKLLPVDILNKMGKVREV